MMELVGVMMGLAVTVVMCALVIFFGTAGD